MEGTFLSLLLCGILSLIAGLFRTRLHWRPDIAPFSRDTRSWDVLIHPERYAKADALRGIRLLNGLGVLLLAGAVAVLALEAGTL